MRARGGRGGARGRVGLELESGSVGKRKTRPTGGARLAVSPGGEKGAGPERAERQGERAGGEERGGAPAGPKQKKTAREKGEKRKKGKVGRAESRYRERKGFVFFF